MPVKHLQATLCSVQLAQRAPSKGTSAWESKPAWAFMGKLLSWPACVAISPTMGLGTGQIRGHGRKIKCQRRGHGWVLDTSEVIFLSGSSSRPSPDSDSGEGKCPRGGRARWLEAGIWARKVTPAPHLHISTSPRGHSPEPEAFPVSQLPKTGSSNKLSVTVAAVH